MAGLFLDAGLTQLQSNMLEPGSSVGSPDTVALVTNNPSLVPTLLYTDFTFIPAYSPTHPIPWSISLVSGSHYSVASVTLNFDLSSVTSGTVVYGVLYFDFTSHTAFYVEYFPAPFTVGPGSTSLTWVQNLKYGDCTYA